MDMQDLSHCQSQLLPKFGAEAASTLLGKWNEACQNRIHVAACKHMDLASTSQQSQIHCFLKSGWSCESSSWMFITSSCFSHCSIWEVATETHAHSPTRPLAHSPSLYSPQVFEASALGVTWWNTIYIHGSYIYDIYVNTKSRALEICADSTSRGGTATLPPLNWKSSWSRSRCPDSCTA